MSNRLLPKPEDAVAAIIIVEGKYLLQLRDKRPEIYFPNYWGLFGGAVETGESECTALKREIMEELGLEINLKNCLMSFDFDLQMMKFGTFKRSFYEVELNEKEIKEIRLREGQKYQLFSRNEVLNRKITPYDAFAIWWHINQDSVKK
jgi:8-oxo-dGTP diphosphatase